VIIAIITVTCRGRDIGRREGRRDGGRLRRDMRRDMRRDRGEIEVKRETKD
jgi:hypothetical protein